MTPGNGAFREPELCRVTLYDGSMAMGQGYIIADRDGLKPHRFNLRSLMAQFFNR
jgi:hypothetical protein